MSEAHYGGTPVFICGDGSSIGGQHTMVAAARMPQALDDLLIGYRGFNLPRAVVQRALDVQALTLTDPGTIGGDRPRRCPN